MNAIDYITESEAINIAGVSTTTLDRFVETGYLNCKKSDQGSQFLKSEICALFGVDYDTSAAENTEDTEIITEEDAKTQQVASESREANIAADNKNTANDNCIPFPGAKNGSNNLAEPEHSDSDRKYSELELELQRYKMLNEMHEKLLERRDQEIRDLRKQRSWLQERITSFEEKAERDQLLLISETQLIAKMIQQQRTESPFKKMLVWLGLMDENSATRNTIEFNSNKKSN